MDKDTVNQDGNLLGRLGALAVIVASVVALGRVCGLSASICPMSSSKMCPFSSKAAPAATQPK
jgi:hypothetical protein